MAKIIMGIQVEYRRAEANNVQEILTQYGCFIKTRLGLHRASDDRAVCSEDGLVIVEFINDCDEEAAKMEKELKKLLGVNVRKMIF